MKKTIKEIKEALPNLKSEKVEILSDELDKVLAIKTLFKSDGGKLLITRLRNNCALSMRKAVEAAKSGNNTVPYILDYAANLDLLQSLGDLSLEEELREQLDEAVREAMGE